MIAVIKLAGKQYVVKEGDKIKVAKIPQKEEESFEIDNVLLLSDQEGKSFELGTPVLEKAKVKAKVLKKGKDKKVTILKHRAKKRYKLKKGHRQEYSQIQIQKIG
ncbi:MAG: 50S ribosomal protein L21 [Candidatus Moranbacteria bacterium]|nr:50S ribosomal protein L21 [Candidatus Moranbacteria bacterium]